MRIIRGAAPAWYCSLPTSVVVSLNMADVMANAAQPNCSEPIPFNGTARLAQMAAQYGGASVSQIQVDNGITVNTASNGSANVTVRCPVGAWSSPAAVGANNTYNDRAVRPFVGVCQPGDFVTSFGIGTFLHNGTHAALHSLLMTCSPGTRFNNFSFSAQPSGTSQSPPSVVTNGGGFEEITFTATDRVVHSLLGVGNASHGESVTFTCPDSKQITGFSAGASPEASLAGWIVNLQFLCQGAGAGAALVGPPEQPLWCAHLDLTQNTLQRPQPSARSSTAQLVPSPPTINQSPIQPNPHHGTPDPEYELEMAQEPRNGTAECVPSGSACSYYTTDASDTAWWSVAAKLDTNPYELLRSNPKVSNISLTAGQQLFVPPCLDGTISTPLS